MTKEVCLSLTRLVRFTKINNIFFKIHILTLHVNPSPMKVVILYMTYLCFKKIIDGRLYTYLLRLLLFIHTSAMRIVFLLSFIVLMAWHLLLSLDLSIFGILCVPILTHGRKDYLNFFCPSHNFTNVCVTAFWLAYDDAVVSKENSLKFL